MNVILSQSPGFVEGWIHTHNISTYHLQSLARMYSEQVLDNEYTDELEELLLPPECYRGLTNRLPVHDRPTEVLVSKSMELQTRSVSDSHSAHTWSLETAITPEDDERMSKPFPLVRRDSTANIRSTGSGGVRPDRRGDSGMSR